jgi:hypothetical protein
MAKPKLDLAPEPASLPIECIALLIQNIISPAMLPDRWVAHL